MASATDIREPADQDAPRILPPELYPSVEHLVTEDDTPVDNIFSEKQQRLLTEPLYSSADCWAGERQFVALANVGLFNTIRRPAFVPDMLLSMDVKLPANLWPKSNRSYFIWEYGKPPEVVVEVVSNKKGGEASEKLVAYAQIGIPYYVIHDPEMLLSDQVMTGYRREGAEYKLMEEPLWFPPVGLGLNLWQGRFEGHEDTWLRWIDESGSPITTGNERSRQEHARAEQEHARAEQEHARAEQEHARAEQERARAERLAEQLRRLGADPEA